MIELLQKILGDNWEIIFGGSSGLIGIIGFLGLKWLRNKSVNQAISTVTGFFTKDMTAEETTEFAVIAKNVLNRKSLNILSNLINQLEKFDTEQVQGYVNDGMAIISAMLKVMIDNKAFDENPTLKATLENIVVKYI